jgi:hypothetical protein
MPPALVVRAGSHVLSIMVADRPGLPEEMTMRFSSRWNRRLAGERSLEAKSCSTRICRPWLERLEDRTLLSGSTSAQDLYAQLPLAFEANQGQSDPQVEFLSRGEGYGLFLTKTEAVLSLAAPGQGASAPQGEVLTFQLLGANPNPLFQGLDPLAGKSNYYLGQDPTKWRSDITNYAKVEVQQVYPGIDLVYYGRQRQLEYDFVVAPGADPAAIRLHFEGATSISLDGQGNLVIHAGAGDLTEHAPQLYQQVDGSRQPVQGHYVLVDANTVGFSVGPFDQSLPLTIDPVLSYATYLGGAGGESGQDIVALPDGVCITGQTTSPNLPGATNALVPPEDVFVTKLNADGTQFVFSTYLGGTVTTAAQIAHAIDTEGVDIFVAGSTSSPDFPYTSFHASSPPGSGHPLAFVARFDSQGHFLQATDLGDYVTSATDLVDRGNNIYVAARGTFAPLLVLLDLGLGQQSSYALSLPGAQYFDTSLAVDRLGSSVYWAGSVAPTGSAAVQLIGPGPGGTVYQPVLGSLQFPAGGTDAWVAKITTSAAQPFRYFTYLAVQRGFK